MRARRMQHVLVVALVAASAVALSACGSTKTLTETNTVVKESTTTVTTTETSPGPTTAASVAAPPPGSAPVLSGTYNLDQTASGADINLDSHNLHDGLWNADKTWTFSNGSCTATSCQVTLRRLLSDSTIEDLTVFSTSPAGAYTGTIPGGDGKAGCGNNLTATVKLSIIIRVGGLQNTGGQTIAQRLAGHIFADYQCPGNGDTHDVSTYVGTPS